MPSVRPGRVPIFLLVLLVQSARADWPAVRAGQGRTGAVESTAHPPYTLLWTRSTATATASDPLIAFGRVFLADAGSRITALDLMTGTLVWRNGTAAGPGELRSHELGDGRVRWSRTLGERLLRAPQVNQADGFAVTTDGTVTALRQGTGDVLWSARVAAPVTTAAADGSAVVLGAGKSARALHPATGAGIFDVHLNGPLAFVPVLTGNAVYLPLADAVVSLDRAGKRRWKVQLRKPLGAPLVVSATGIVAASTDGSIRLLGDRKGAEIWEALIAGTPATLVASGVVVYVGTKQGTIVGLRLTDGRPVWSANLGKGAITGLAAADGRLVVAAGPWTVSLRPAPSAPDDVRIASDDGRVRLAWTEGSPNGSPITGYRVWRRRGGGMSLAGATSSATRLYDESPLGGETEYVVTTVATDGAESVPSDPAKHAALDPILTRLTVTPLPFDSRRGELTVGFELRLASRVTWRVVDPDGADVTINRTEILAPGKNSIIWDGRAKDRRHVDPGHYKIKLTADASGLADSATGSLSVAWGFDATGGNGPGSGGQGVVGGTAPAGGGPVASGPAGAGTPGTGGGTPHDSGVHAGENPQGFVIDHNPGGNSKGQGGGNSKGGGH